MRRSSSSLLPTVRMFWILHCCDRTFWTARSYPVLPDVRGREQILKVHMRKVPLGDDVNASVIARGDARTSLCRWPT